MFEVIFSSKSFDKGPWDCAVITVNQDRRPLQGYAALVDWRLNGRLSRLILQERFSGSWKETLLLPAEGRIHEKGILALGVGVEDSFDEGRAAQFILFLLEKLSLMQVSSVALSLHEICPQSFDWRNMVRYLVARLEEYPPLQKVAFYEPPSLIQEVQRRRMDFGEKVEIFFEQM